MHEPGLAHSLHNVVVDLFALRRFAEPVSAAREATVLCARAAVDEPAAFRQPLATLVNNLRKALLQLGLPHDVLAATRDTVSMYRRLADQNPAVFLRTAGKDWRSPLPAPRSPLCRPPRPDRRGLT
ncbi:hypothetical protein [Streptomyces sp. NPDC047079]|uniref:hypothetical protein n=1 Tax=Streptomyces sp. NPDC047079 TaxID=3154607 RepID=UPI0033D0C4E4